METNNTSKEGLKDRLDGTLVTYYRNCVIRNHMSSCKVQYEKFVKSQKEKGIEYNRELNNDDFHTLAMQFIKKKNPEIADNTTWANIIAKYLENDIVNTDCKEYIIPVEWSVYSTVVVRGAKNLEEAKRIVENNITDIPLPEHANYIEDSYHIQPEDEDELQNAQSYTTRGVLLDATSSGISYKRLE